MPTEMLIAYLLVWSGSSFFLKYVIRFDTKLGNCVTPFVVALLGIFITTQLTNYSEAIAFLSAATLKFTAYVFVSRLRQRGSFFWHVMASLFANGGWYVTMHILDLSGASWMLMLPYVVGIIAGRTTGVVWAQYIEKRFDLQADATRNDKLAPGKRLQYMKQEKTFWVLILALISYLMYGSFSFDPAMKFSLYLVIGFGILQNFTYALNTRASQRGNNWYIASSGLLSGVTFFVSATYLFSIDMPLLLLIPYMLSTALGSATGAFLSMVIEWTLGLAPDDHLKDRDKHLTEAEKKQKRAKAMLPYKIIMVFALVWILFEKYLLALFGYAISPLNFPLPIFDESTVIPRILIVLAAAAIFMLDSALHAMSSRAGNRNHAGYHVSALIPKGLADFTKASYIKDNSKIPEIIPIAILAGSLGSLYGKDISEKIERWLQARMDVGDKKEKK